MRLGSSAATIPRRVRMPLGWLLYLPVLWLLWIGAGWALLAALAPLTPRIQGLVTIFLGIFIEALPFVLAGVLRVRVTGSIVRRPSDGTPDLVINGAQAAPVERLAEPYLYP